MSEEQTLPSSVASATDSVETQPDVIPVVETETKQYDVQSTEPVTEKGETTASAPPVPPPFEAKSAISEETERSDAVYQRKMNAQLDYAIFKETGTGSPDTVALPATNRTELEAQMAHTPNTDWAATEAQLKWYQTLQSSLAKIPYDASYEKRLDETDTDFKQFFESGGKRYLGRMPKLDESSGNRTVEGELALLQLMSHLGAGGLFHTPLMNSGFWVAFKPTPEDELIELNRAIAADKVYLGRETYGFSFTNSMCYTVDRIFSVALKHVYFTSVKKEELPLEKLRDYIVSQDLWTFIWGWLCANYPNGFQYTRSCVNNPTKCNYVAEGTCDLTKMLHIDNSMLTEWQKSHMATFKDNSRTLGQVKQYQDQMVKAAPYRFVLNTGTKHEVAVTLKPPTISQYIEQGQTWVSKIVETVQRTLGEQSTLESRQHQEEMMLKASKLCEYLHWVQSIEFGALTPKDGMEGSFQRTITDTATIERALATLSGNDAMREEIINKIQEYVGHSTVALIGLEAFICPHCHTVNLEETKRYPRHVNVLPIDLLQVFFSLLGQRLSRIGER